MLISSTDLQKLMPELEVLVRQMGEYALSKWETIEPHPKGDSGDLITDADLYIEEKLRIELAKLYNAPIVGEEEGGAETNGLYWVVDPIDGTKHFAHRMPSFFTQLALVEDKEPVLGLLFDPVANHMFTGSVGNGTKLNGKELFVQNPIPLSKSIIDIDFGGQMAAAWKSEIVKKLAEKVYRIRITAGRFSPYLLTGGVNVYLVINPETKIWDQYPKLILYKEAGYEVMEFEANNVKNKVIAEKSLAKVVYDLINY